MDKVQIEKAKNLLADKNQPIVIVSHVNPDGDAIGSALGLYHYLRNDKYQNLRVIIPNGYPSFLAWMPGSDEITIATEDKQQSRNLIEHAKVIFCLDFNDLARTDQLSEPLTRTKATKILIDHHPEPQDQFDLIFSSQLSSTAELIYKIIEAFGKEHLIDIHAAQCLYAGIITDTGSFSYACNHPQTYYIAGRFIEMGVDGERIHRLIYDNYSEDRMRLLGHCLGVNMKVFTNFHTAYIYLSNEDLKKFNYREGDTEGVVNYALSIKDISLAAIFIEKKNEIKVSFRSEGALNVNVLARKYFNGGGHHNAAGGSFLGSLQECLLYFEKLIDNVSKDDFKAIKQV